MRIFVAGLGLISAAGDGVEAHREALRKGANCLSPIALFPVAGGNPLPVGEGRESFDLALPRTHGLALRAAAEALAKSPSAPDAIVVGSTTGGILTTEDLLRRGEKDPASYRFHDIGTVAEALARQFHCVGPALTVSTACSSSALAIKVALELMRTGAARRVLVGGVDSLSRLTYYGFASLQLIDPAGCRPFDRDRKGMNVAEAAAFLLLEAADESPADALAEICGGGLSCDAYHGAAPDPEGKGALAAMRAALADAGIAPEEIDYINLHGTGTANNDLAEARAVRALFANPPPASSTKGIFGHALGAAGALEAAICTLAVSEDFVPPNVGFGSADPEIGLTPVTAPTARPIRTALTNSLGFGGNNACVVLRKPNLAGAGKPLRDVRPLSILGVACLTAKGELADTLASLRRGETCFGKLANDIVSRDLPPRFIRRLERLPLLVLNLASRAVQAAGGEAKPQAIFFGTGHGPLSETDNFLRKLFESDERFGSAIDFVGSVHNAPASQAAIFFNATGANVTATGGDYSFEQALLMAGLLADEAAGPILVAGADEANDHLSPLFDRSAHDGPPSSDGGGALLLSPRAEAGAATIRVIFFQAATNNPAVIASLSSAVGELDDTCGALFVGLPLASRALGERQLAQLLAAVDFAGPVFDYRRRLGEYPTVTAVATAVAVQIVRDGQLPECLAAGDERRLDGKSILVVGLGNIVTCGEIRQS